MTTCALCDLPTPDPPVTADGVQGGFCCQGCLAVARTLDGEATTADVDPETVLSAEAGDETADGETAFLAVDGMHCATCEAFLESRARTAEGVLDAAASYSSGLVRLAYDPDRIDRDALPGVLDGTGYTAQPAEVETEPGDAEGLGRLLVGGFFGMMVMLWYGLFLYPAYLGVPAGSLLLDVEGSAGGYLLANVWVMTTVVLGYTGYPRLRGAYVSLRAGHPNMDLLVSLAAVAAYGYSTAVLLFGGTEVYFDVVVAIVVVVAIGDRYESRIRRRAAGHLADLAAARVEEARRRTAAGLETVAIEDLDAGDVVVVRPGDRVPVDGTVVEGTAAVDESLLTGEPDPQSIEPDDDVIAGSVLADGSIDVAVEDPDSSTLDRLVAHLWSVQSGRPGVQALADRLAAVFVPLAVALAVAATTWRLFGGVTPRVALLAGLSVLVVSCPCALGLATPLAVSRGVREALEKGIVVTAASAFERGADVEVVALDKTGTLTTGEMAVLDLDVADGETEAGVLRHAAAVEARSGHPVAEAILDHAPTPLPDATAFERHAGGVSGRVDGTRVVVGRRDLLEEHGLAVPDALATRAEAARATGAVPTFVGWAGSARGLLTVGDRPREGWADTIEELAADRTIVVISGDDRAGTEPFADHPSVDEVFAGVPPEAKAEVVSRLRSRGPVAMVGDGTNDASALAAADLGIAIERGAALAADAADAVITTDDLGAVPTVLSLTAATRRRVRWNLGWAFGYNAIAVPVALAGLLNPLIAAAAMAGSSLLVVGNSSRRLLPLDDVDGSSAPGATSTSSGPSGTAVAGRDE